MYGGARQGMGWQQRTESSTRILCDGAWRDSVRYGVEWQGKFRFAGV